MADLPEYKRRHETVTPLQKQSITPGVSIHFPEIHGMHETFNQVGKSTSYIGEIGAAIAQNAANQYAEIQGKKSAQENPGMDLLPAFTEADSHFVKAFEQEAHNEAIFSINNLIQKQYDIVASQPLNSNSLNLYEKNVTPGIEGIMQNVPEKMRSDLQRDAVTAYNHSFYKLSNAVTKQARRDLRFNINRNLDQNLKTITDMSSDGFTKDAENILKHSVDTINENEKSGILPHKIAQTWRDAFYISYYSAKNQTKISELFDKGKPNEALEYLDEVSKNKPEDIPKKAHSAVINNMDKTLHSKINNKLINEDVKYIEMQNKERNGTLTTNDMVSLGSEIGSANWNKWNNLHKAGDRRFKELLISETNIALAIKNKKSLDAFSNGQIKNYAQTLTDNFTTHFGREPNTMELATIHYHINDPRSGFGERLNDLLEYGDVEQAANAAEVLRNFNGVKDAKFLKKVNTQSRLTSRIYEAILSSNKNLNPVDALSQARKQTSGLSKEEQETRLSFYKQSEGSAGKALLNAEQEVLESVNNLRDSYFGLIKKGSVFKELDLPPKLISDYEDNKKALYLGGKDLQIAREEAARLTFENWGLSEFNGKINNKPTIMEKPIERLLEGTNVTVTQAKNKMLVQLMTVFDTQKKKYEDNNAPFYYQFAPGEIIELNKLMETLKTGKPIYKNQEIKANKIYRNINNEIITEPGYIKIDSDNLTKRAESGNATSYPIYWVSQKRNEKHPIYSPNNINKNIRFSPLRKANKDNN